jgi:uncharacterized integral membrane protein
MASDTSPSGEADPASSPPQQPGAVTPEASELPKSPDVGTSPELTGAVKPPKSTGAQAPLQVAPATTRAAAAWFATAVALVLLVLLIILILQNQNVVRVNYLGFTGSIPLGTALLIAAVAGAAVVTIVGVIRLTQLRFTARRTRRLEAEHEKDRPLTKEGLDADKGVQRDSDGF